MESNSLGFKLVYCKLHIRLVEVTKTDLRANKHIHLFTGFGKYGCEFHSHKACSHDYCMLRQFGHIQKVCAVMNVFPAGDFRNYRRQSCGDYNPFGCIGLVADSYGMLIHNETLAVGHIYAVFLELSVQECGQSCDSYSLVFHEAGPVNAEVSLLAYSFISFYC